MILLQIFFKEKIPNNIENSMARMADILKPERIILVRGEQYYYSPYSSQHNVIVLDKASVTRECFNYIKLIDPKHIEWWENYIKRKYSFHSDLIRLCYAANTPNLFYSDADIRPDSKFDIGYERNKPGFGLFGDGQDFYMINVNGCTYFFQQMLLELPRRNITFPTRWLCSRDKMVKAYTIKGITEVTRGKSV
jgi:hypothetical protein